MLNLEQLRSRNALAFAKSEQGQQSGANGGEVIKKIPPLILNNGLLATLAYGFDQNRQGEYRNKGHRFTFDAIAKHLSDPANPILPEDCSNSEAMARHLTSPEGDSQTLKLCTAEAMEWLNYARRFVNRTH